jgi:hypothetical protein
MKGFFSVFLIIISVIIIFDLILIINKTNSSFSEINNELIAMENASRERTIIEKNIDKIVQKGLEETIFFNYDSKTSLENINIKLERYLKGKVFETNLFSNSKKEINKNRLNNLSVVSVFKTKQLSFAQYTFSSDITKTTILSKALGKNLFLEFKLPIDYSQELIK